MERVPKVEVPVYFLMGRHDRNTPPELVEEFMSNLEAPRGKHLIMFEESAHTPFLEETTRFAKVLSAIRSELQLGPGE